MTTRREAEETARDIVNKFTAGAVGVSLLPGSGFALGAADVLLVNEISKAFGCGTAEADAFIASAVMTAAGKTAVNLLLEVVPLVKQVVAGAGTKALGEAAISYFRSRSPYPQG
jgi:uncharacterized protein (DUF697 family)